MRKGIFIFGLSILAACNSTAQIYLEPLTGYQTGVNRRPHFQQISTGLSAVWIAGRNYELSVRVQRNWGFAAHSVDSSFTTDPSLPLFAPAREVIVPTGWTFSLDHRFILKSQHPDRHFSILLFSGFSSQKIAVRYTGDAAHYTVLNPDATQKKFSLFGGTGMEYMKYLGPDRVFVQLTISSPPLNGVIKYPSSFSFMSPLSFLFGYSIHIKRKKHEN